MKLDSSMLLGITIVSIKVKFSLSVLSVVSILISAFFWASDLLVFDFVSSVGSSSNIFKKICLYRIWEKNKKYIP